MPTDRSNIAQTQLRRVIADRLRAAILAREIKPSEWLRQEQLAREFGVSHTPVREALQDLVSEGFVEHVPYRGIRVVEFSATDLLDLYACRAFQESLAARYAALNITPEELAELKNIFQALEQHPINEQLAEHRRLHRQFHQLIYTASRHDYLIHSLEQMWTRFPTMMLSNFAQTAQQPVGRGAAAMEEHRQIKTALEAHDSEAAERLMRQHIEATASSIAAVLKPTIPS